MELNAMLTAKKNAANSTVLEYLSGRSPICGNNNRPSNVPFVPMVILVGPPKTRRKYFLNQILKKHADKFYRAFIYTTNSVCKNRTYKIITTQDFNKMSCTGKLIFSYRFLGYFYGLGEDELYKCTSENKILITFANLEGALSIKLKGYNPILILLLPVDKLFYKQNIYQSIEKYMNQNSQLIEKKTAFDKNTVEQILKANDGSNSISPKSEDFTLETSVVCSLGTDKDVYDKTKSIPEHHKNVKCDFSHSTLNDLCAIFSNECLNNLNICYNLYENSTDIFHSLIYVDNSQRALNEIIMVMVDVYTKYQNNKLSKIQKQPNEHTLEHIQTRRKQLYNELSD